MAKLLVSCIMLLASAGLQAKMVYTCEADKARAIGNEGGEWSSMTSAAQKKWILEIVDGAAYAGHSGTKTPTEGTRGLTVPTNSTTWKLTQVGDNSTTYCEQAADSPVIFCEEGLEGDFVLSIHTLRFIRSHLATTARERDSVTVGKCVPQG